MDGIRNKKECSSSTIVLSPAIDQSTMEKEIDEALKRAKALLFSENPNPIEALEIIESMNWVYGKYDCSERLHFLQGYIFRRLAKAIENKDVRCTYLLGSIGSYRKSSHLSPDSLPTLRAYADSLLNLADVLASDTYYEKAVLKAKQGLALLKSKEMLVCHEDTRGRTKTQEHVKKVKEKLENLIKLVEVKMSRRKLKVLYIAANGAKHKLSSRLPRKARHHAECRSDSSIAERFRTFWARMDVKGKRKFFIVKIKDLEDYVEEKYGSPGRQALERGEEFAKTRKKWKLWKCGACSQEFYRSAECKKHIELKHMENRPSKDLIPQRASERWGEMIDFGDWEPVDIKAAIGVMKDRFPLEKQITYDKGWSKEWPLAGEDKARSDILKEFHKILKYLFDQKILSYRFLGWLIESTHEKLVVYGIPQNYLVYFDLVNTVQCLCFLELCELEHIKCSLVSMRENVNWDFIYRAVDGFCSKYLEKERIYSDNQFSCLLLDKRLLRGNIDSFDEDGIVEVCSSVKHYTGVTPQGDEIISWLFDCPLIDRQFLDQRPITGNLCIWLAVFRIIEYSCWKLKTKCERKVRIQAYSEALVKVEELCDSEEGNRENDPEGEWKTYASILLEKSQKRVMNNEGRSSDTICFLSVVRDVLEGAKSPRFDDLQMERYWDCLSGPSNVDDNSIVENLAALKISANEKLHLTDSKILLHDHLRDLLLDGLTNLSMFDHRSVILPLIKWFLRETLERKIDEDAKEKSEAARTALLLAIEKEEHKKCRRTKKTSRRKEGENKVCNVENAPTCSLFVFLSVSVIVLENVLMILQEASAEPCSVDQKTQVDPSVRNECDPSDESGHVPWLLKTEEDHQLELVIDKDNVDVSVREDPYPEDEPSSSCEQLKNSSNPDIQEEISGNGSVDQKTEVHEYDTSDGCGDVPELMKAEEEEQLVHVDDKDNANIMEVPCLEDEPSTEQLKNSSNPNIQKGISGNGSVDQKTEVDPSVRHEYDPSNESGNIPELKKTEEDEQLEHVDGKDNVNIRGDPCPESKPSSTSEQLKNPPNPDFQMETVTTESAGPPIVHQSALLQHHIQLDETASFTQLISATVEDDIAYDSALDMILKSLWHISFFKKEFPLCQPPGPKHTKKSDRRVFCALHNVLSLFEEKPIDDVTNEMLYHFLLGDLRIFLKVTHPMENSVAELLGAIFEFLHSWESPYGESLVESLFGLEEFKRMNCTRCQRERNYPELCCYGLVISADVLRGIKSEFGNVTFENALEVIRVNRMMLCDPVRGGCGHRNHVHQFLTRFPFVFTIVLEWKNNESEEEISNTATVLDTEIDISVLFEDVNPLIKYRLVSMVSLGKEEHNCIAYENERWVIYARSAKEDIGDWESVLKLCSKRKVRPQILFFEAIWWTEKL
ncbi:PREDICTED: uncharacterized protein LOC104805708 isoform X2 [Tarenaya hassleriana]|uniref:uncharacterized protein LOC104805708 isoform X2 n=1 Tax=Tarenaya hassleriana TaxID=28532 RepID=UPI00053C099E|nr:PREDICTED: uncharacterized protein LOC104805708 isoform X2 [Tarenaya hassleriana]